jgi:hypothetical protein
MRPLKARRVVGSDSQENAAAKQLPIVAVVDSLWQVLATSILKVKFYIFFIIDIRGPDTLHRPSKTTRLRHLLNRAYLVALSQVRIALHHAQSSMAERISDF